MSSKKKGQIARSTRRPAVAQPLIAELRAKTQEYRDHFSREAGRLSKEIDRNQQRQNAEKTARMLAEFERQARLAAGGGENKVELGGFLGHESGALHSVAQRLRDQGFDVKIQHCDSVLADDADPEHPPTDYLIVTW